jgi:hypothetical protein
MHGYTYLVPTIKVPSSDWWIAPREPAETKEPAVIGISIHLLLK